MKVCRCLLKDVSEEQFALEVEQYIKALPKETRADDHTYRLRLEACLNCEKLVNGFCSVCGCMVELRAAKSFTVCPDTPKKW